MNIKTLLLFVILTILNSCLHAQSFTRRARIINLSGDTLYRYVSDRQWKINPAKIKVISNLEHTETEEYLFPSQVKAVIIDSGDYYVSAFVHADKMYSKAIEITRVVSTDTSSKDSIFLRVLAQGQLDLYLYTDENNKDHFFVKNNTSDYLELIYKDIPNKYLPLDIILANRIDTSTNYLVNYSDYKNKLNILFQDCPDAQKKIDKTEYKEKDMLRLFDAYNNCINNNGKIVFLSNTKVSIASCSFLAGLASTQIHFGGEDYNSYLDRSSFSRSYSPALGFRFYLPLDRNLEQLRFLSDIYWWNYDTKSDYYGGFDNEYQVHLRSDYVKICIAPEYKYSKRKIQPYINGGMSVSYLLNLVNKKHVIHHASNWSHSPTEFDGLAISNPHRFNAGIFGSLGAEYERVTMEFRYELNGGFVNSASLLSNVKCMYLFFTYRITNSSR